jgi:hypothetical protein
MSQIWEEVRKMYVARGAVRRFVKEAMGSNASAGQGEDGGPEESEVEMTEAPALADFSKKAQAFVNSRAGGLLNTTLVDSVEELGKELDGTIGSLHDDGGQVKVLRTAWAQLLGALEEIGGTQ